MRYSELFEFDPIETIIELREADKKSSAKKLVRTYVISDRMAAQLTDIIIPQIQFEKPLDNKGVLIVGNYGTGKSHLMSVISAIAEHDDLVADLNHDSVRDEAVKIAGKFKVIRVEIGAVTASLRNILVREIEGAFKDWGISYQFPSADTITGNKDALIEAVGLFQEKYPDTGVLLIVDELLDYLRSRDEQKIILDLGFLRELGEISKSTPFRFIGGLQEALFDNVKFSFVSDQLRRVRDRFEQVRIVREDIAFVVSNRLLKKNDKQIAIITEHLQKFTPLYKNMAERISEYARLFPIHPAYIEVFGDVYIAEKREVLKTFSKAMQALLNEEVPGNKPGLISYDQYWDVVQDDPAIRSIPEVAEVIDKSKALSGRVRNAYSREHLLPIAIRIINALSVMRLTTDDIKAPIGPTPEELRDNLCLFVEIPEKNEEFLLDQVQVALKEISRTVSGQYLSHNEANNQYYIDVEKNIDYDAIIEEKGSFLGPNGLNRYFFDALRQEFDLSETTYVTGHKIWFFELLWPEKKVTRPGYFFFGKPDERSTAQPPRDFYVYFAPPFSDFQWNGDVYPNEVIFQLKSFGPGFEAIIREYAGSRALSIDAASYRDVYADKADECYRRKLSPWLRENIAKNLYVYHQGVTKPITEALKETKSSASRNIQELVNVVAANLLSPEFEDLYPDYPAFTNAQQPISEEARSTSAREAISYLSGRGITRLGRVILRGLGLIDDDDKIRPYDSLYANHFLKILQSKPENQVVNRGELIELVASGLTPIEKDLRFKLEPEWVVVVLLALVYNGDLIINLEGKTALDASSIEKAAVTAIQELKDFRFISRPKELPINTWTLVFEGLGLTPGLIKDTNTREEAVKTLQTYVQAELKRVVEIDHKLDNGLRLWNTQIFTDNILFVVEKGVVIGSNQPEVNLSVTDLKPIIRGYKQLLEELNKFNTVGKLRNFRMTKQEIEDALEDKKSVQRIEELVKLVSDIQPITTYLVGAQANLPSDHPWSEKTKKTNKNLLDTIRKFGSGDIEKISSHALIREIETLKKEYITVYSEFHRDLILGANDDDKRRKLYEDPRLKALQTLNQLELTSGSELETWTNWATELISCREFHEGVIEDNPTCPYCNLQPKAQKHISDAKERLAILDHMLDDMLKGWRQALTDALSSEIAQKSLEAMTPKECKPVKEFLKQKVDDAQIPTGFIDAAQKALLGISSITLPVDELIKALKAGGVPSTLAEMQRRFNDFLQVHLKGHDPENTRLTLDQ
jgi:hypothetical protein